MCWGVKERALQAAELEVTSHTKRVQVNRLSQEMINLNLYYKQQTLAGADDDTAEMF